MRMEDEIAALRREVQHLIAMHTASYVTITSLIATHPNPEHFQLHLITALESVLGSERLGKWTEEQKAIVRRVVETFQNVRPASPIDPLKTAMGDRDPRQH
jgi:hypothetical protein